MEILPCTYISLWWIEMGTVITVVDDLFPSEFSIMFWVTRTKLVSQNILFKHFFIYTQNWSSRVRLWALEGLQPAPELRRKAQMIELLTRVSDIWMTTLSSGYSVRWNNPSIEVCEVVQSTNSSLWLLNYGSWIFFIVQPALLCWDCQVMLMTFA